MPTEPLLMKRDLILEALDASHFAIAFVDTNEHIVWANSIFFQTLSCRNNLTSSDHITTLIKPMLSSSGFQELLESIQSDQARTLYCTSTKQNSLDLSIQIGAVVSEHRTITFLQHNADSATVNQLEVDPLTGLGNRLMLERFIDAPLRNRDHTNPSIMIVDLDRFKRVNDTLGHPIGDKLLKLVANRFRKLIRPADHLMRLSGDEFILVIREKIELCDLVALAKRFIVSACKTFIIQSQQIDISASVGIAVACDFYKDWHELYRHADLALYESKKLGCSQISVFTPEIEQRAQYRRAMEICLRRALIKNELYLMYLPQIDVATKKLTGFEGILHWHSAKLGHVTPESFLPIAEEIGEINKIGYWLLDKSMNEMKYWQLKYTLSLSMMLTQLNDRDFSSHFDTLLLKHDLSANQIELIVPEKALLDKNTQDTIKSLSNLGVRIALESPTVGYHSLCNLKSFPISRLRVHHDLLNDSNSKITDTIDIISNISDILGIPIVAQGIKSEDEFCCLKRSGLSKLQGIYSNSILNTDQVREMLDRINDQRKREGHHEESL